MKKFALFVIMGLFPLYGFAEAEMAVTFHKLQSGNVGDSVGVIVAKETPSGLVLEPYLNHLEMGTYELTVHENASCHGRYKPDGTVIPGASAGKKIANLPPLEIRLGGLQPQSLVARGSLER